MALMSPPVEVPPVIAQVLDLAPEVPHLAAQVLEVAVVLGHLAPEVPHLAAQVLVLALDVSPGRWR